MAPCCGLGALCAPLNVPVLGINAGRFGFLTELQSNNWDKLLPLLLEGKFRIEQRMMLRAEHWRQDQCLGEWDVLNEVVVARGQFVRPVVLKASVDGYRLASYVADGLIVSTPTGSTAYALAVGGPIMPPELRNILIIPVAPHLSIDRAVILPEGVRVVD
jgi:NAD+ kinase